MTNKKPYSTQTGAVDAYDVEEYDTNLDCWVRIDCKLSPSLLLFAPYPDHPWVNLIKHVHLLGESQAHAIAWSYSAILESRGKQIEVRVVKRDIHYNVDIYESEGEDQ